MGGVRNRQGRWSESISACRQAIAEAESVGERRALAHACYVLDLALVESGHPQEASHSGRALEIYEELGDPEHEAMALNNLGGLAYWAGHWDDSVSFYQRAAACGERAGRPADVAYTDCNLGEILSDQGHLDAAEARLRNARRVWSGTGEHESVAFVDTMLARIDLRRGRYAEALPALEATVAEFRRFGMDAYVDLGQALIAEAEAAFGDADRALEIAGAELEQADRYRSLLHRASALALARLGTAEAAASELRDALAAARERDAKYDVAATIDLLDALAGAVPELRAERDAILARLKIRELPTAILVRLARPPASPAAAV
jgi:tetratricopeptide (TPR) repeat protein